MILYRLHEIHIQNNYHKIKYYFYFELGEDLSGQKDLHLIQNKNNILFCGSYFGYGFHEDGIKSSIDMIKYINA